MLFLHAKKCFPTFQLFEAGALRFWEDYVRIVAAFSVCGSGISVQFARGYVAERVSCAHVAVMTSSGGRVATAGGPGKPSVIVVQKTGGRKPVTTRNPQQHTQLASPFEKVREFSSSPRIILQTYTACQPIKKVGDSNSLLSLSAQEDFE